MSPHFLKQSFLFQSVVLDLLNLICLILKQNSPIQVAVIKDDIVKHYDCCCYSEGHYEYQDIITNRIGNEMDISLTKQYDSRSFYRTFEYQGRAYYKIGKPYVKDTNCCCYKKKPEVKTDSRNSKKTLCKYI